MIGLFNIIISLIKKEPLVLYPSLIGAFLTSWLVIFLKINVQDLKYNFSLFLYLLIVWLLSTFITLLTAELGRSVAANKNYTFPQALLKTFLRFPSAIFGVCFLAGLIVGLLVLAQLNVVITIFAVPLLIILALFFQLLPIIYVISSKNILQSILILIKVLFEKFRLLLSIFVFLVFVFSLSALLFSLFEQFPDNLRSLLIPIWQGLANVFIIYAVIIFWQVNLPGSKINIQA